MPDNRLRFSPNVPQQVTLQETDAKPVDGSWSKLSYLLSDGREMQVSREVATTINMMDLKPGESFSICQYWNGERKQPKRWCVWLSPDTEKARAVVEMAGASAKEFWQTSEPTPDPTRLTDADRPTPPIVAVRELEYEPIVADQLKTAKPIPLKLGLEEAMEKFLLMAGRASHRARGGSGGRRDWAN